MSRILIIEDNLNIRENLEDYLLLKDYEVTTAENGLKGINSFFENKPDFIICDIAMPIKNGYEVFEALSPHLKEDNIPFMFLTASAQEKDLAQGKASGADAYVVKPYNSDDLLRLIKRLLNT